MWPQYPPANPPGASPEARKRVEVIEQAEELPPAPPYGPREPEAIRLLRERARAGTLMLIRNAIANLITATARAVEARARHEAEAVRALEEARGRRRYDLKHGPI